MKGCRGRWPNPSVRIVSQSNMHEGPSGLERRLVLRLRNLRQTRRFERENVTEEEPSRGEIDLALRESADEGSVDFRGRGRDGGGSRNRREGAASHPRRLQG